MNLLPIGEKMTIKKFYQKLFVTCLFLLLLILPCLNACQKSKETTKQSLFESIDAYIKNTENPHFAMLSWGSFSFFGTEMFDDGKIFCNYRGSYYEEFSVSFDKNFKTEGIFFDYSLSTENPMNSSLVFYTSGTVYAEEYSNEKVFAFDTVSVPTKHADRISYLFQEFLSCLENGILRNCGYSLKDFGYY